MEKVIRFFFIRFFVPSFFFLISSAAFAGANYTRFDVNAVYGRDNFPDTTSIQMGAGYRFDIGIRTDFIVGYRENNDWRSTNVAPGADVRGKVQTLSLWQSLYIDLIKTGRFRPYIGGGGGYALNRTRQTYDAVSGAFLGGDTLHGWSYHFGGGIAFGLTEKIFFDAGYRYADYGYTHVRSNLSEGILPAKEAYRAHELQMGIRYQF